MDVKDTNPKDAVAIAECRLQLSVIPWRALPRMPSNPAEWCALSEVALAMTEGAHKYGRHNYRVAGVRASVYFDAFMRHMIARELGENIDPDSGLPHLVKALTGLLVLRDSVAGGNWVDDRPPITWDNAHFEIAVEPPLTPIGFMMSWWDFTQDAALEWAIEALLGTRAAEIADSWGPAGPVSDLWRAACKSGALALAERLGGTPAKAPFTHK